MRCRSVATATPSVHLFISQPMHGVEQTGSYRFIQAGITYCNTLQYGNLLYYCDVDMSLNVESLVGKSKFNHYLDFLVQCFPNTKQKAKKLGLIK